jgi:hypothetical protein
MARPLATKVTMRDVSQLLVDLRVQSFGDIGVAAAELQKKIGDLLGWGHVDSKIASAADSRKPWPDPRADRLRPAAHRCRVPGRDRAFS